MVGFDRDGDENAQLYAMPPQGGQLKPLRVQEGQRHLFSTLSEDGKRLYYTSTKGNQTYLNSYVYHVDQDEEEVLLEGQGGATYLVEVSPQEQSLFYVKHFANTYVLGFIRKNGHDYSLTPATEDQHTISDGVYVNENEIYFITDYAEDDSYLAHYNIETDTFTKVLFKRGEEFSSLKYDKDRQLLYIISSKGVEDKLYQYDMQTEQLKEIETPVDVLEKLVVTKQGNVYLLGHSATLPFNIYVNKVNEPHWQEITYYRVPGVERSDLVEPEVLTYPSYDGLDIEALLFQAKPEVSNGYLILWPHGGPQAAERKMFRFLFQFLLNRGYSIFAPNFRGSSGYGLSYMKMVEGDWGHGPRLDNIAGLDYLIEQGYADKDKILLMGGSFGGYMALLLHGRHAEYFKAVVDIFGVSNLFSFIDSVPEHWKPIMKQWVGDPEEDRERLERDTPITYLDDMTKPMLVIQDANDPRVVKAESDQVVQALREKGREIEYLVLEDEGHGFSKKENEMKMYRKVLDFLDRFVD